MSNAFEFEIDRFETFNCNGPIEAIHIHGLPDVSVGLGGTLTIRSDQSWRFIQRLGDTFRELADDLDQEAASPDPVAMADLITTEGGYLWRVRRCPYCGRQHIHGGGKPDDDPLDYLGDRLSHCTSGPGWGQRYRLESIEVDRFLEAHRES